MRGRAPRGTQPGHVEVVGGVGPGQVELAGRVGGQRRGTPGGEAEEGGAAAERGAVVDGGRQGAAGSPVGPGQHHTGGVVRVGDHGRALALSGPFSSVDFGDGLSVGGGVSHL